MRKLVVLLLVLGVVLAVLVGGLLYADVQVREYAEEQAETQLAGAVPMASGADVEIDAFPFVGRVLLDGTVKRLDVQLRDLRTEQLDVERVSLQIEGLVIDRDVLLSDRKLAIKGLQSGSVDASITSAALDEVTPVDTRLRGGKIEITYQGVTVEGKIAVKKRHLVIAVPGIDSLRVPLPEEKYLPCDPTVKVDGEKLRVTCTIHELPRAVADVLGH